MGTGYLRSGGTARGTVPYLDAPGWRGTVCDPVERGARTGSKTSSPEGTHMFLRTAVGR